MADPDPDIPMVLEGEASQVTEAVGKYVLGVSVEPSEDWIPDLGEVRREKQLTYQGLFLGPIDDIKYGVDFYG